MHEHLAMRSILNLKQDQVNLEPMALTSYYTSMMFYWTAVLLVTLVFILESLGLVSSSV